MEQRRERGGGGAENLCGRGTPRHRTVAHKARRRSRMSKNVAPSVSVLLSKCISFVENEDNTDLSIRRMSKTKKESSMSTKQIYQ